MNLTPHRALALLVATTLTPVVATLTLTGSPARAATTSTAPLLYAKQAFRAANAVREDRDRVRTRSNACLQRFANRQANALAATNLPALQHSHHQDLDPVLRRCGLHLAGENLALGFPGGRAAVTAWMRSPSHRANILERRYRLMAVAARQTDAGAWIAVQLFGRKA